MNMNSGNNFEWLFNWFYNQCDGDWEHGNGISIGTLDNPGWFIKIDIRETELHNKEFKEIFIDRSDHDWISCDIKEGVFQGYCGPFNFHEILQIFRAWAQS